MNKTQIISFIILYLGLSLNSNGQIKKDYLPLGLNELDHNVWVAWPDNFLDSAAKFKNGLNGNPFQHIKALYPSDSISIEAMKLSGNELNMFILTFGDSLNIQTYNAKEKKITKKAVYAYKKCHSENAVI
jgi:hypothetical protein